MTAPLNNLVIYTPKRNGGEDYFSFMNRLLRLGYKMREIESFWEKEIFSAWSGKYTKYDVDKTPKEQFAIRFYTEGIKDKA